MRRMIPKWLRGIGVMILSGTFVLANIGTSIPHAGAAGSPPPAELLTLLKEINAKLNALTDSLGNIQEGNHTQRWDQNLPAAQRFEILAAFNNQAVLDKNTGLVWEKIPRELFKVGTTAATICLNKTVGGTSGWRLPSVVELKSVQDPTLPPPFVPASIFPLIEQERYWSSTHYSITGVPGNASRVSFASGTVDAAPKHDSDILAHAWCVRGPMQESSY